MMSEGFPNLSLLNIHKMTKQHTIKVSEDTWKTLMQVKLDKRCPSIDYLLNNYYTIKEDVENGNTR